jgi:serine/threonine protein kinase
MSPEQMLTPASVDQRADIWSIGVLLFELLTDRLPFDGESVPQVCANVLATAPLRPSEIRSDVSPELDAIVLCCLEKEPQRRFPSVNDLARALRPFVSAQVATDAGSPAPAAFNDPEPAFELYDPPAYDSFTPLHSSHDLHPLRPRARMRGRPLAVLLVALASLVCGGYLQYRDPTLVRRAIHATRITLPWDPSLSSEPPPIPLERTYEAPTLLQVRHGSLATPEPPRREVTYTPIYIATPRERSPLRDSGEPRPALPGPKSSVEERYGF